MTAAVKYWKKVGDRLNEGIYELLALLLGMLNNNFSM